MQAVYLRIDTIEQALRDLCNYKVEGEGYALAHRVAADNLRLGMDVIADSCNPVDLTRTEWQGIATSNGANFVNIEVVCSDKREHEHRIRTRSSEVLGLKLPDWQAVVEREYDPWTQHRIMIDTAGQTIDESVERLLTALADLRSDEF